MYNELRDKIKEELQTISSIGEVRDSAIVGNNNFPLVVFEPYSLDNKDININQSEQEIKFKIIVFQEYERIEKSMAWEILMNVSEEIVKKFRLNLLDGLCNNVSITNGEYGTDQTENGKNVYGILYLSIKVLVNN